jgi:type II secretory pathway pseudopilin PulG
MPGRSPLSRCGRRVAGGAWRRGISLVEALVATTLMVMTGGAVLLAVGGSLGASQEALEQTVAAGLAEQLMDEILGKRYHAVGASPLQWPLGPNSNEGPHRANYDDVDDLRGYARQPPVDMYNRRLGYDNGTGGTRHPAFAVSSEMLRYWRQEVDVYYVSSSDPSIRLAPGATSYHRAVEVRIVARLPGRSPRTLATVRRVITYLPPP